MTCHFETLNQSLFTPKGVKNCEPTASRLRDAMPLPAKRWAGVGQRIHTRGRSRTHARFAIHIEHFINRKKYG
jgi:hypothetical protein